MILVLAKHVMLVKRYSNFAGSGLKSIFYYPSDIQTTLNIWLRVNLKAGVSRTKCQFISTINTTYRLENHKKFLLELYELILQKIDVSTTYI